MARDVAKTLDQVEKQFLSSDTKQDKRTEEKTLVVDRDDFGLYFIKWTAGGELPLSLSGRYTALQRALDDIANYKATQLQQ